MLQSSYLSGYDAIEYKEPEHSGDESRMYGCEDQKCCSALLEDGSIGENLKCQCQDISSQKCPELDTTLRKSNVRGLARSIPRQCTHRPLLGVC
jgi:hypothetical protein